MQRAFVVCALVAHAAAELELNCQVFEGVIVCDHMRERLARAEVRTCSG